MMYQKALLFNDYEAAKEVLKASNPRKAKAIGRNVRNFDEVRWNAVREGVVRQGNILKFTNAVTEQGFRIGTGADLPPIVGSLKEMLLATGERELVEASPFDKIWGIGYTAADADHTKRSCWGLNLLGKVLMEVRETLRDG